MFWKIETTLEETANVLMLSRTSVWIFSRKFTAYSQIKLSLDRHRKGTISENTRLQKIIRS